MPEDWEREVDLVRAQVLSCRDCHLCDRGSGPVPLSLPTAPNSDGAEVRRFTRPRFAVIGEAPGRREDRLGRPFSGPSGKLMRSMLTTAGLHHTTAAFLNTVSCWPARTPSDAEQHACWKNMLDQLRVTNVQYVITAGAVALESLVKGAKLKYAEGGMFSVDWLPTKHPILVMPTYHPSYVLREKYIKQHIYNSLWRFKQVMDGTFPIEWAVKSSCVFCGEGSMLLTSTVPCCHKCKPKLQSNKKRWLKEKKFRNKKAQLSLEIE